MLCTIHFSPLFTLTRAGHHDAECEYRRAGAARRRHLHNHNFPNWPPARRAEPFDRFPVAAEDSAAGWARAGDQCWHRAGTATPELGVDAESSLCMSSCTELLKINAQCAVAADDQGPCTAPLLAGMSPMG